MHHQARKKMSTSLDQLKVPQEIDTELSRKEKKTIMRQWKNYILKVASNINDLNIVTSIARRETNNLVFLKGIDNLLKVKTNQLGIENGPRLIENIKVLIPTSISQLRIPKSVPRRLRDRISVSGSNIYNVDVDKAIKNWSDFIRYRVDTRGDIDEVTYVLGELDIVDENIELKFIEAIDNEIQKRAKELDIEHPTRLTQNIDDYRRTIGARKRQVRDRGLAARENRRRPSRRK